MMTPGPTIARRMVPLLAGGLSFVAYLLTLLPGMAFGDWGEMQTVPHVLGVAHPTGYPTYVLLGWVAQLVPIGTVAFRANLLSAVLVAATVATCSMILLRIEVRPILAVAGSLALGAVGTVWAAATVAEVNALHLLFVALLVHRALVWEARRSPIDLAIGGLLLGLALGNHLLLVFVAPFIGIFVLWVGRREIAARPWITLLGAGALLLGLSVYAYIPIAAGMNPPLPYNDPVTLDGVWWLVSGHQFRDQFDFLTPSGPGDLVDSLPALWAVLVDRGTFVLPALGAVGLILLVIRRPAFGLMAIGILVTDVYIWANYLHLEHYLLAPWLFLAIGAAYAIEVLVDTLSLLSRERWRRSESVAVGVLALAAAIGLASINWQAADRSGDDGGEMYAETVFDRLPADAAILTPWDASAPLWHAQFVRGERPDVLIVDDTNIVYEGWGTREARIASLICDRPVFILRLRDTDLDSTRAAYRLEPGFDVRVGFGGPTASAIRPVQQVVSRGGDCP
jgi:Protein O-mannosyl-transferase TMEM260-like